MKHQNLIFIFASLNLFLAGTNVAFGYSQGQWVFVVAGLIVGLVGGVYPLHLVVIEKETASFNQGVRSGTTAFYYQILETIKKFKDDEVPSNPIDL